MALQYDFDSSIGFAVCFAAQAFQRALNEELLKHGITFRQWQVLALLALDGELSQAELAERMGIEGPTLVRVLDRMERDGWIRRHACPHDRRKKLIRPTEQVEPVWGQMVECAHRIRARAIANLDPFLLAQSREVLNQLRDNLLRATPADPLPNGTREASASWSHRVELRPSVKTGG